MSNTTLIKNADWVIDLGPGAGDQGGELIAAGTPEELVKHPDSHTAHYLRSVLEDSRAPMAEAVAAAGN